MLTVQEARDRILAQLSALEPEAVDLESAAGRVLAEDIAARQDVPPFANSAMDGYAVRALDVRAATPDRPVRLQVVGEVQAGNPPPTAVAAGTALRIMTGAMLPDGADAVVRTEDTSEADHRVEVRRSVEEGTSIRPAGSDLRAGDVVARSGQVLTPGVLGVVASAGRAAVRCVRRPRVAVLTTGDELRPAGEALRPGEITNTNRYTLRAAIEEVHGDVVDAGVARDDRHALETSLGTAQGADLVITSGGVSMGRYDLVRRLLEEQGSLDFWQVALRPGKPLVFGSLRGVPLIGLPGNPVSSLVAFELFARPAILKLQGRHDLTRPRERALVDEPLENPPHLEQYFRGIARRTEGTLRVRLTGDQGSHVLRSMADANCLIVMPLGTSLLPAGAEVDIIPLAPIV